MTIGIEHANDYPHSIRIRNLATDSIQGSIRTEISDSQVPKWNMWMFVQSVEWGYSSNDICFIIMQDLQASNH